MIGHKPVSRRAKRLLLAGTAAILLLPVGVYVANPHQAASKDPRERIVGYGIYQVPSMSMQPTLMKGETIFMRAGHYRRNPPVRGDIAVYALPGRGSLLKRIVALPGHARNFLLPKGFAMPASEGYSRDMASYRVPAGHVFVMGDYRDRSEDSRMLGPVPIDALEGRVVTE